MSKDFKQTLRDFAERNSQTKTWIGEVITAPDADGKCKVRISGDTAQTCTAIGSVSRGDKLTVLRFPGSVRPVVVGMGASTSGVQSASLPLTVDHDLVAHALDGEFHTGSIRNDQGPQFALLTGERPFLGQVTINPPSVTAPFVLGANAQGQLVNGLNADFLNGYHADAFALAGHNHTHANLLGLAADDHTQYLNVLRHDTTDRHTLGTVVPHDDHGYLSGLLDDDHPQYAALAQTETITGAWTFQGTLHTRHIYPEAPDSYDIGSQTYMYRHAWISELDAVVYALNTTSIFGGSFAVPKRVGKLPSLVRDSDTIIDFGQTMYANEFVVFRSAGQVEYMQVGSQDKDTIYNVTRNLDLSGANDWPAETVFAVYGASGDGRVEIVGGNIPRISVILQGATYNAQTEIVRLGQLTGMPGIAGSPHGIFIGSASQYLKYHDGTLTIAGDGSGITNINGGNISLSSSISINSSTWNTDGVQLQYNAGNPRAYIGNGTNRFFMFDGTDIAWAGANTSLTTTGLFTAANANITGTIDANAGYLGSLTVDGLLSLNATGELRAGDTTNGLRLGYLTDGYYLRGVGGGNTQVEIRAADGKLYAGGGNVWLNSDGIGLICDNDGGHVRWSNSAGFQPGYTKGEIFTNVSGGTILKAISYPLSSYFPSSQIYLEARENTTDQTKWAKLTLASSASTPTMSFNGYLTTSGSIYINETTNTKMTLGLTINQGGADNEILDFKSSDVAHSFTTDVEADTFGRALKNNSTNGGLVIDGFGAGLLGLRLGGASHTGETTKATTSGGRVLIEAWGISGTTRGGIGANENLAIFRNATTTRFILDGDGDSHQDVGTSWTNFDSYDDAVLLQDLSVAVSREDDPIRREFGEFLKYNPAALEKTRLVTFNPDGHHFVNMSRLSMLLVGAVRQLSARVSRYEAALLELGVDPKLLRA